MCISTVLDTGFLGATCSSLLVTGARKAGNITPECSSIRLLFEDPPGASRACQAPVISVS